MHELSIAMQLIEQIQEVAEANQLPRVDEVLLETGVLRQVVPELMQTAFQEATRETLAEGAVLTVAEIPARASCNRCVQEFTPEVDNYLCPQCRVADVKILEGDKIILKSVSCNKD